MVRALLAFVFVALAASASFAYNDDIIAKRWKLDISGGYTTFVMTDVNDDYDAISAVPPTKIDNGTLGAVEWLYRASPAFALGARMEYLTANQGKANVLGFDVKEDLSMLPVMVGGRYALKRMSERPGETFCENCGLSLGAFIGYATAWGRTSNDTTIKYSGSGFAGDILFGWEHRIVNDIRLGLNLGYRYAPVSEMQTTQDYPDLGASKGATIIDSSGNTLEYDFSGMIATLGVGFVF